MFFRLAASALLSIGATSASQLQGVFTTSNAAEKNEVASYAIADDGSLTFVGAYDTGGIGYPFQESTGTGFTAWTGANCVSYHVNGDDQWLLVSNMGGSAMEPSMSIFKIAPDLTLTRTDVADVLPGTWAESVTGYGDRACVLGTGESIKVQCFRISEAGELSEDWMYDLKTTMDLNIVERGHSDGPTLQFSPDGTKLGVLSKGSVDAVFPFSRTPSQNVPQVINQAGFYSFPVVEAGYGDPLVLEIDAYRRPYDFVWSPTSDRVWTVGIPNFVDNMEGNAETIDVADDGLTSVGFVTYGTVPTAPCWVEYLNGVLYVSNFVVNNDLGILQVEDNGEVDADSFVSFPFGDGTAPVDIAISGARESGAQYLYAQLSGTAEIGSYLINDDGSLTEVGRYPIIPDAATTTWISNAGVATTTLSVVELKALEHSSPGPTPMSTPGGTSATSSGSVLASSIIGMVLSFLVIGAIF